jgi:hypothetical protein
MTVMHITCGKKPGTHLHGDALEPKNNRFRTKEEQETITSFESNEEDQFASVPFRG